MEVPPSLRTWFVVHAVLDLVCGVPLLLCPELVLPHLGWASVDPVMTRLVGAALLAIGAQAWRSRGAGVEVYRALLGLNVVWSAMVILGMAIAIARGAPSAAFLVLSASLALCGVWSHHAIRFRQLAGVAAAAEADEPAADDQDAGASQDAAATDPPA